MSHTSFVGRKEELRSLNLLLTKKSPSLAVIRGRRRIGKSCLVGEFAKGKRFLEFTGIAPTENVTDQSQRDVFSKQLGDQLDLPGLMSQDWAALFTLLAKQTQTGRVVILFDEISWMGSKDPTFLGKLKNAWDRELKRNPELILILCGSVSTWIEENIIQSTAFFGRISLNLTLEELPLRDCNKLLEVQGFRGSFYEKFKILSVTGGVPWYIEQIKPSLNADDNIKELCFRKDGILVDEFDLIFHDLFTKRSELYKKIIEILVKGPLEFNQICKELNYAKSGVLSGYLEDLMKAGFISRDFTWILKTGKESRLSHFRLSDNYLRFYLKCVSQHKYKIRQDSFKDVSLSHLPGWESIMGFQFENLVLKNRRSLKKFLGIRSEDVVADNPFFQRKTSTYEGCQIDYLIQTQFNVLYICEIKFSKKEIKSEIIQDMKNKIKKLVLPRGFSCCPVLIHVNGVADAILEKNIFSNIIDFSELLDGDES